MMEVKADTDHQEAADNRRTSSPPGVDGFYTLTSQHFSFIHFSSIQFKNT